MLIHPYPVQFARVVLHIRHSVIRQYTLENYFFYYRTIQCQSNIRRMKYKYKILTPVQYGNKVIVKNFVAGGCVVLRMGSRKSDDISSGGKRIPSFHSVPVEDLVPVMPGGAADFKVYYPYYRLLLPLFLERIVLEVFIRVKYFFRRKGL